MLNLNTVRLEEVLGTRNATNLDMVDPAETGDSVAGDYSWLTYGDAAGACLLLTSDASTGEFPPVVSNARMVQAAHQAGFKPALTVQMPSSGSLTVWTRQVAISKCTILN